MSLPSGVKIALGSDSRACGIQSPKVVDMLQAGDATTALRHPWSCPAACQEPAPSLQLAMREGAGGIEPR